MIKVVTGSRWLGALPVVLAVAVTVGGAGPVGAAPTGEGTGPEPQTVSASGFCPDAEELAFLSKINLYRAQNGLGPLRVSRTLAAAADHHSRDMASRNYFSHGLSGGVSWSQNIRNHGYSYNTYKGENIAAGNARAEATFVQWRNSPGHRANMLNRTYTAIGIGRAYNAAATYDWYWTTTFGGQVATGITAC